MCVCMCLRCTYGISHLPISSLNSHISSSSHSYNFHYSADTYGKVLAFRKYFHLTSYYFLFLFTHNARFAFVNGIFVLSARRQREVKSLQIPFDTLHVTLPCRRGLVEAHTCTCSSECMLVCSYLRQVGIGIFKEMSKKKIFGEFQNL